MAERAEEGMDNENDCGAENDSLSPKLSLLDAEARDEGMRKYANGENGVPGRENGESLPSPRQNYEAAKAIELEDMFAHALDQGSALLSPLDEQQESAPKEDASEKGGLIDSKHTTDIDPVDMEPQIEGLEEIRQGEDPVEIEQESAVKAPAEIQHELDGEPSVEGQSIALDLHETDQDLAQRLQGNTGDSEVGEGDASGREQCNIDGSQEQFMNDAAGMSFTTGVSQEAGDVQQQGAPELVDKDIVVNPEKSEEKFEDHSASEELNQQMNLEIPIDNASEEPPAAAVPGDSLLMKEPSLSTPAMEPAAAVPNDSLLMKEPSLSTPAMEALVDADNKEPSHEKESFETVENSEQHPEANETQEDSSAGGDREDALEGISNQVEVDSNELRRAENNAFGEDVSSFTAARSADEVLTPSDQELGMDMSSADGKDGKEESGDELPLVFMQETERELDIVAEEPPAATVPDDSLSMKEPSLSTPAMEALNDADNEEPSHEKESFETVENSEQHLEANETQEDSSAGGDREHAFEGISNQVEVGNNEQRRAEYNAFGEDVSSLAAAEIADEVLIPSGQELGTADMSSAEKDGEEELGNEIPLGFKQETDLEMASDTNEKGDKAVPLKAEDTLNAGIADADEAATFEVVEGDAITDCLEETNSENESALQALNGEQGLNNPHNKESDEAIFEQLHTEGLSTGQDKCSDRMSDEVLPSEGETGSEAKIHAANGQLDEDPNQKVQDEDYSAHMAPCSDNLMEGNHLIENCVKSSTLSEPLSERDHEGEDIGNAVTSTQLESTADDISNGMLESSVTPAPNEFHLSEHVLENGDSLQSCPSRENGGEVEGSYVEHSTEPVLLGKLSDGMTEGEAPMTVLSGNGLVYHHEDDKQNADESSEVMEVGTQAAEAKGGAKGVPTSTSDSLAQENGFHKRKEEDYTTGTTNTCIADQENAQAFHNERSRETSLSLVAPQQRDRASEHVGQKDVDRTNGRGTLARRTNWWGCCGMLDLLLHKG